MKQQDLFAHFQACKKVSQTFKKPPPSCPNPYISTPKRQPGFFFIYCFLTFVIVPEVYSKSFSKKQAILMLQTDTMPTLSTQTTELLAQLKAQPIVTSNKLNVITPELIENSSSLRERYKELLKPKVELILPVEYKRLLKVFIVIEEAVQMCLMRGETPWSSLIGEYSLRNCAIKFELIKLQQILTVMADAYKVKWGMNEKNGNLDLILTIDDDNNTKMQIEERRKQFKIALYNIVKQHHQEFLKTLPRSEANQFTEECWHPKFDVHHVPSIPLAMLPEKNVKGQFKHYQSVVDFIKANEIKNAKVKQILEQNVKEIENKENNNCLNEENFQKQRSLGLSDTLIAKIKEKERLLNESRQSIAYSKQLFQISDKERLKNVASIIKTYASMRKVSNIFYVQVIDHIAQGNKQCLMGKEQISQIIDKLIGICPNWLQLINHSQGKILRIDKSSDISQILQEIEQVK